MLNGYNKNLEASGEKIVLKIVEEPGKNRTYGDIIIPDSSDKGFRATKAEVVSIGSDVPESEGIKVGDIVLYDTYSVFYDVKPIVVTNYENIICRVEED